MHRFNKRTNMKKEMLNSLIISIKNEPGSSLPATGGVGTSVFYTSGILLLLVSATLLYSRKRTLFGS